MRHTEAIEMMAQQKSGNASGMRMMGSQSLTDTRARWFWTAAWALLLLFGALFLFAAVSDLAADLRGGLPADHAPAFAQVAGLSWPQAARSDPALTRFITLLETAYAVHELVFGLLFLVIVAIPFRQRRRWAWWACWVPLLADLAYTLTFGRHDPTILARSLIADIGLPLLLLIHIPVYFPRTRNAGVE